MKRYTIIIIMYTVLMLLVGCGAEIGGWQTGNVTLVRVVGVEPLLPEGVRLTAFGEDTLVADGATVAAGMHILGSGGERFVHFGHVDQLLLDEAFVREGVDSLLEFVARDRQIGPGARLWVLRGEGMDSLVSAQSDVAARLVRLANGRGGAEPKLDCTVTRLMSVMARDGSVAVPAVTLEQGELVPAGYAVLRQGRLVGFLEGNQALGLELLQGQGAGQLVEVPGDRDGTFNLKRVQVGCEAVLGNEGVYGFRLRCGAQADVTQGTWQSERSREAAIRQAELILCDRMAATLACVSLWDADFVGLEHAGRGTCSEQEWDALVQDTNLRTLPLQVAAEVHVQWPSTGMEGLPDA